MNIAAAASPAPAAHICRGRGSWQCMSVQTARENAVLDTLASRTRTVRDITSALDGDGMPLSSAGVRDLLAGLIRRGLASQAGTAYQLTEAGRASVRRRKSGYSGARGPVGSRLTAPAGSAAPAGTAARASRLRWAARQQAWR